MPQELIHPDKQEWIRQGDEEVNKLFPTLSNKEKSYLSLITSENYNEMVSNIEKYLGVTPTRTNLPSLVSALFQSVNKVIQIESQHKTALEELALNTVLNLEEFKIVQEAYINDEVRFQVKLEQPTRADFKLDDTPKNGDLSELEQLNQDLANILDGKDLKDVPTQRRFANLLITGGAFSKMYLFHMVEGKLKAINQQLPKLYGALGVLAELGYLISPDGVEEAAASGDQQAGVEEVVPEGDIYIIKAKGLTFPYLIHEIVKGVYEWLSISPETKSVLGKEKISQETRDVLVGPALFKKIIGMVPAGKQYLMPLIQQKLISIPTKDAQEVLSQSDKGKQIFNELVNKSEQEWNEYKKNKADYHYGF